MLTLVLLSTNEFGVLARVASIISSTSVNIQRCSVSSLPDPSLAVLSFQLEASEDQMRAIERKTTRLVQVLEVLWGDNGKLFSNANPGLRLMNELRGRWDQVA
ncbi:MAG: hypothetical protein KJZ70_19195 [Bryobacterales bacterium]|nr:hypothetical protein [Bryobacterales bacterium]